LSRASKNILTSFQLSSSGSFAQNLAPPELWFNETLLKDTIAEYLLISESLEFSCLMQLSSIILQLHRLRKIGKVGHWKLVNTNQVLTKCGWFGHFLTISSRETIISAAHKKYNQRSQEKKTGLTFH